jgi:tetratricopeptide (TPR) repeat protein
MKLRENLYQELVYRPKVRALQASAGEGDPIFAEFQKILDAASTRLAEARPEVEALLAHTRAQFKTLLAAHCENGFVTRYLIENAELVEEVFRDGLDALLEEIHGSAALAHERAARSYLASGYFPEALNVLDQARRRGLGTSASPRLAAYADGMQRYIEGHYPEAIARLGAWLDARPAPDEAPFAKLAQAAAQRVGELGHVAGPDRTAASKLATRLGALLEEASASASSL